MQIVLCFIAQVVLVIPTTGLQFRLAETFEANTRQINPKLFRKLAADTADPRSEFVSTLEDLERASDIDLKDTERHHYLEEALSLDSHDATTPYAVPDSPSEKDIDLGDLDKENFHIHYHQEGKDDTMPSAVITVGDHAPTNEMFKHGLNVATEQLARQDIDQMGVIVDVSKNELKNENRPGWDIISTVLQWSNDNKDLLKDKVAKSAFVVPDTITGNLLESAVNGLSSIFSGGIFGNQITVVHNVDDAKKWISKSEAATAEKSFQKGAGTA